MINGNFDEIKDGDEVMKQIGVLGDHVEELGKIKHEVDLEPEEVGTWITAIGKALLAIFKP